MAKKKSNYMTPTERVGGTIFFFVYLLVLPLLAHKLFALVGTLLGVTIGESLENILFYYLLFAVTLLLFHRFLWNTTRVFFENLNGALVTLCVSLLLFYGANELFYRVANVLMGSRVNLNDVTIAAQVNSAPRMTGLIVIFLAPFVEEVLFRGLVFGGLRASGRVLAYVISCALFAFLHVWTFALSNWDLSYFVLMLQYLVPGFVFAWAYDRSGTLWTSILLHGLVNALSMWTMLS